MTKLTPLVLFFLFSFQSLAGEKNKTNRLIHESSPYLLQHAHNPVDWYPWGEEAFARARKENKPLFISIGYSTCHWCHVMAHESFENPAIAKLLNQHFISVKVDREERPDIDRIYLTASEIMNGYSGWPTTIITTTELKPFFAGTYIPTHAKQGQQGLTDILSKVVTLWQDDRNRVRQVANEITQLIRQQLESQHTNGTFNPDSIDLAYQHFSKVFDAEHGGFGNAPKFPRMPLLDFLISYGDIKPGGKAHTMVTQTLDRMLLGGLYDHVGGGFHRYSVDAEWQVPHFEKMLYDQGLITNSLIEAELKIPNTNYKPAIRKSLDFVLEKMQNRDGGFYSAYDADSTRPDNPAEHGEGAYYIWSKKELDQLLNKEQQTVFYTWFNIQSKGNVVSDPQNEFTGLNVLYAEHSIKELANSMKMSVSKAQQIIQDSLNILKTTREKRPLPHLDDKIITSWNALIIRSLSRASKLLNDKKYLDAAQHSARFLYRHLYDPKTQTLYRSYRNGNHSGEAYLDDYAYLINALINLHQQTSDRQWLVWADSLMQSQIKLFQDTRNHGFFDNTNSDKNILIRSKEIYDGVLPSANAITVENLNRLSRLQKKPEWSKLAKQTIDTFHESLNELVENFPQMYRSYLISQSDK